VAPERRRALLETEEVVTKTLSDDTLPMSKPCKIKALNSADKNAISRILTSLQHDSTSQAAGALAKEELEYASDIHAFAADASHWAEERQDNTQRRQELFNKRMQLPVAQAVKRLEDRKYPAEKVYATDIVPVPMIHTEEETFGGAATKKLVASSHLEATKDITAIGTVMVNLGKRFEQRCTLSHIYSIRFRHLPFYYCPLLVIKNFNPN